MTESAVDILIEEIVVRRTRRVDTRSRIRFGSNRRKVNSPHGRPWYVPETSNWNQTTLDELIVLAVDIKIHTKVEKVIVIRGQQIFGEQRAVKSIVESRSVGHVLGCDTLGSIKTSRADLNSNRTILLEDVVNKIIVVSYGGGVSDN